MSDIIKTTSDLFLPTYNMLKFKSLFAFVKIGQNPRASIPYAMTHEKATAVSDIENLPWLLRIFYYRFRGLNYQMCARLSAGTNSLSPSFMPNAEYHASIIGSAAFTRRLLGECTSLFTI